MVYHIDFHILKNPCTLRINPTWSCCMSFLMYCWILFAKILLRNFEFIFISDIGLFSLVQFSSVTQSCPTLCDPMNRRTPGLPVHHQLPEFTQTHVHQVTDAIQPSHPLSSPSPPAPNPSQLQSLLNESVLRMRWPKTVVSASASVLPMNTQDWYPLGWTGWISLQSKGLSRVFSNTTVQKHQLFGAELSSLSNSHIHTWPLEKGILIL